MFSATLPPNIVKMSAKYLNNPERISASALSRRRLRIFIRELINVGEGEKYQTLLTQLNGQELHHAHFRESEIRHRETGG